MSHAPLLTMVASYVSPLVVRRFALDPTPPRAPTVDHFPTAVLFADIAGFTALTERLAQHSPAGAEELISLLNRYFGQLIDIVTAHGGDVVKFAGDALLACWPVIATDDDLPTVTHRAAQCGLAVQAALHNYEITQNVHLSLHVSIGAGDVSVMHVGGIFDRWEFLIAGEPLVQVSLAEQYAYPGQVILTPIAWELLRDQCIGQPLPAGHARLYAMPTPPCMPPTTLPTLIPEMETALLEYIPAAIVARLRAGHSEWLGELRRVTVLFVNLPDLTYTTPLAQAQTIMRALQTALYRYEGSVNKLSVDDKGVTLVAALGLPPLAHEDDAIRGVLAAQAMQATLRDLGMRSTIGVTTGRVFCGMIGNITRSEYTIMGDVVNLAARLMQAAPEDILCDSSTYQAARRRFTFDPLPPRHVKGKAAPVPVYRPCGPVQSTIAPARTLIGRKTERRYLMDRLQAVLHRGVGGLVVIEGEAGIGKSYLVDDLYHQAQAVGVSVLMGAGDALEQTIPYRPWQEIFCQLFHVESCMKDPKVLWTQVRAQLPADPEVERLAPLLAAVLPVQIPDTDLTAQLVGQVRADRTHALLARVLHSVAVQTPMVLILEDAHWFDSVSWILLEVVCRQVPSALIVITTRPLADPIPEAYRLLHQRNRTSRIHLTPFSVDDTVALVCQSLGVTTLPAPVIDLIRVKAAGHPFFSEELAYALRDAGVIRVTEEECHLAPDVGDLRTIPFPETLESVITSRLDRLPPAHQLLLKVASVVGTVVPMRLLHTINPMAMEATSMVDILAALQQAGFLLLEHTAQDRAYHFKHILTHEVIYNLLPLAQRRPLHRAVAEWYERVYVNDLARFYPLLAHHYTEAGLNERAILYWQHAGQYASERAANIEAIRHFSQGLSLIQSMPEGEARWQQEIALQMAIGASLIATKGYGVPEVEQAYTRALELCEFLGDRPRLFWVLWGLGAFYQARSELTKALEKGKYLKHLAALEHKPALLVEAHFGVGSTLFMLGKLQDAREELNAGIAWYSAVRRSRVGGRGSREASPTGHHAGLLSLLYRSLVLWHLGYPDQAQQESNAAIALASEISHPYNLAWTLIFEALLRQVLDDRAASQARAEEALTLSNEYGFPIPASWAAMLLSWAAVSTGLEDEGITNLRAALAAYRASGCRFLLTYFLSLLAVSLEKAERFAEGLATIDEALREADRSGERFWEAELYRLKGRLESFTAPPMLAKAEWSLQKALDIARRQRARSLALRTALTFERLMQSQGKPSQAHRLLREVYAEFTEGFDTADLVQAKAVLEEFSAGTSQRDRG
ncbi:MAG: adenylate/guanylate cyclase domain-containing protein [Ktedonobacteraceae bacterium]